MLSFEEFKVYVEDHITDYLPESYGEAEVTMHDVTKNNGLVCHGVTVRAEGQAGGPTVYLDEPYEKYKYEGNLDLVVESLAQTVVNNAFPKEFEGLAAEFKDFDVIKHRIIAVVVNADMNYDLLTRAPHKRLVGDLVAIYKVKIDMTEHDMSTCTILNQHKALWDVSDEELHEIAMKNTELLMPPIVKDMEDVIRGIMEDDMAADEVCADLVGIPEDKRMIVVSNTAGLNGAGVIFYKNNILNSLIDRLGDKIYILPSSVHEVIVIRGDSEDVETLEAMVKEINASEVQLTDILSDHVYMFDAKTQ